GAAPRRRASMRIWILRSTLRSMSELALAATPPLVAGRWSATFGNGRLRTSHRSRDLLPIRTRIIHSRGSAPARCCVAAASRPVRGLPGRNTEISFLPIGTTFLPDSAPVPVERYGTVADFTAQCCSRSRQIGHFEQQARASKQKQRGTPMTMRPDPTFHASPKLAMEAPRENFAYTLLLSPDFSKPDALAVIDVKPGSSTFSQIVHTVTMPN